VEGTQPSTPPAPAPKPAIERTRTWIPLCAIALVLIVIVAVIQVVNPAARPYTAVQGSVPDGARQLPDIPVNETWLKRVAFSGQTSYGPSYVDYQNFSLSHWSMGLHLQGTFWIPIIYPAYTNLTNSNLQTDQLGQYILVPYDAYLGVHLGFFYAYVIVHGVHWAIYDDEPLQANHSDPYILGLLLEEQQYQLRWVYQTQQYTPQELMGYPPSNPYAPSLPLSPQTANITQGYVPVAVDGEGVYANVFFHGHLMPLDGYGGAWNPPVTLSTSYLYIVTRTGSTIFLSAIPFDDLPHTSQDVFFGLMFWFAFDPPILLSNGTWTNDYDPGPGYSGTDAWNDFGAYLQLYAPLG
jgi:hypothetical protein